MLHDSCLLCETINADIFLLQLVETYDITG